MRVTKSAEQLRQEKLAAIKESGKKAIQRYEILLHKAKNLTSANYKYGVMKEKGFEIVL